MHSSGYSVHAIETLEAAVIRSGLNEAFKMLVNNTHDFHVRAAAADDRVMKCVEKSCLIRACVWLLRRIESSKGVVGCIS
jgi:hypothetical protein